MFRRRQITYIVPLVVVGFVQNFAGFVLSARAENNPIETANSESLSATSQKRLEFLEQTFFFKLFPSLVSMLSKPIGAPLCLLLSVAKGFFYFIINPRLILSKTL